MVGDKWKVCAVFYGLSRSMLFSIELFNWTKWKLNESSLNVSPF